MQEVEEVEESTLTCREVSMFETDPLLRCLSCHFGSPRVSSLWRPGVLFCFFFVFFPPRPPGGPRGGHVLEVTARIAPPPPASPPISTADRTETTSIHWWVRRPSLLLSVPSLSLHVSAALPVLPSAPRK